MIKHIILWQLRDDLSPERKQAVAAAVKEHLEGLLGTIDGLTAIRVITDGLASSTADMMLDSTFVSEQALRGYAVHPAHVAVADTYVRPYIKTRSCMDFAL